MEGEKKKKIETHTTEAARKEKFSGESKESLKLVESNKADIIEYPNLAKTCDRMADLGNRDDCYEVERCNLVQQMAGNTGDAIGGNFVS